jgi:hypothetical protein
MPANGSVHCRVAACRESLNDGREWSFYLINDGAAPIDLAVLSEIDYEWGDFGNSETEDVTVADLAPGANALIWRDDGSGAELRMTLNLRLHVQGREVSLQFEFPKLYRLRDLPAVDGLGKPGFAVTAEGGGR